MIRKTFTLLLALCLLLCTATQTAFALTDSEPNNSIADAQTLSLGDKISGEIDTEGDVDIYSFVLEESGRVSISIAAQLYNSCYYLYTEDGRVLWSSTNNRWDSHKTLFADFSYDLDAGTYYYEVNGYRSGTNEPCTGTYSIKTSFEAANATETEENDTLAQAGALTLGQRLTGQISLTDQRDIYTFTLDQAGRISLDLTVNLYNSCYYIYNEEGRTLVSHTHNRWSSGNALYLDYTYDLEPGIYFLEINGYRWDAVEPSTGTYSVTVTFDPANATEDEDNDSLAQSNPLNINSHVVGQISYNDRLDYYTFTLPEDWQIEFDMTSHMTFYTIQVFQENGEQLWYTDNNRWDSTGQLHQQHTLKLPAGTYYMLLTGRRFIDDAYESSTGLYELSLNHVHTYGEWEILIPATLSSEGMMHRTCTCGETEVQVIEKLTFPFIDVKSEDYYYNSVVWAVDGTITNGTDDTHFSPENICTRAQIVTFLWRSQGQPEPVSSENPFVDVVPGENSDWYYKAVLWAVEKGITNGRDATHFDPDGECLRSEVVTFLWRTANQPAVSSDDPFLDVSEDHWFYQPVLWAIREGITNGVDDTHFGPDEECTRAQIVTFLYRSKN